MSIQKTREAAIRITERYDAITKIAFIYKVRDELIDPKEIDLKTALAVYNERYW